MILSIDAIFDHGVLRPVEPLVLPEGARVQLQIEHNAEVGQMAAPEGEPPVGEEIPTLLERMQEFVGTVQDLPADASVNLDHYLYGVPKRS